MKKLLATTLLAATVATGFAAQAEAADKPTNVYSIQLEEADQDQINQILNQVCKSYNLPTQMAVWQKPFTFKLDNKQPAPSATKDPVKQEEVQDQAPAKQEPVKENAPVKEEEPVKESTPAKPAQPAQESTKNPEQQASAVSQEEQQMVDLVNQERSKQGLAPLKINMELTKVARIKAQDMIDKNYFSHQSPTYGSPFDMLSQFGVEYRTAGENLAGNQTVEAAHTALMNSEGHRANILKSDYEEVGIGIVNGGSYGKMFVQLFKG